MRKFVVYFTSNHKIDPPQDIELLGQKVITINLSHNLLTRSPITLIINNRISLNTITSSTTSMPANFPLLSYITKLDLSKNSLVSWKKLK